MNKQIASMAMALVMKAGLSELDVRLLLAGWVTRKNIDTEIIAAGGSIKDEFEAALSYVYGLQKSTLDMNYDHKQSVEDAVLAIAEAKERKGALKGVSSPMPDIDKKINGWQRGLFYVIGGLKKTGKSRFVLSLANHWLKNGLGGIIFSLEMGTRQIHQCVFANRARVNSAVMGTGSITNDEFQRITDEVSKYQTEKLYISNKSAISPDEIKAIITSVKTRWPVDFVVVDYIQRMRVKAESRTKEVERCALDLADMARDEGVIMLALTQLAGSAEKATGDKAVYEYVKESQAIVEAADCALMLFDKNRGIMQDGYGLPRDSKEIIAQIIQRDGESDISFKLNAQLQYSFFGCPDIKHEGENYGQSD